MESSWTGCPPLPRALKEARSIISADALDGHIDLNQRIDVEDELGRLVHRIEFANAVTMGPLGPARPKGSI